ncbi:MAG TPA: hypothetical protein V6D20_15065, partial [Candidatus Obscuribacterales bacterium]
TIQAHPMMVVLGLTAAMLLIECCEAGLGASIQGFAGLRTATRTSPQTAASTTVFVLFVTSKILFSPLRKYDSLRKPS